MKESRRIRRMARNRKSAMKIDLTSIMDIFTTLVFFLLVNQSGTEVLEAPKQITLPASITENKPRETVVIFISKNEVTVQGEVVATPDGVMTSEATNIAPVAERLAQLRSQVIGTSTKAIADSQEVTILADRAVPFTVIKRVMSTCTNEGYARISLAVLQKSPETQLSQN
ncbi:MAG: biopolymer transporter ExbD [Deltaproteobacteria bacterium]|nr:biopolymer transporter ExbD [Deltaproteobacteria bacterium]